MLRIERILFPTDYSECAGQAFHHAAFLAKRFDADLHVLHVEVEAPPVTVGVAGEMIVPVEPTAQAATSAPEVPRVDYVETDVKLQTVDVGHAQSAQAAILDYEKEYDPDLIVMGTHGRTGIDRFLLGSVTEEVVRKAQCPVLTVHARAGQPGQQSFKRILVPIDFSEFTGLSLAYAIEIAHLYGSELVLLHVVEDTLVPNVYGVEPVSLTVPVIENRSREWMDELVQAVLIAAPDVPVQTQVVIGHPASEIARAVDQFACDLTVIATHGRTGVHRLLMGSVTDRVVRKSPSPVFTVKSYGKMLTEPLTPISQMFA